MATVAASLVANPILLRKFAAKLNSASRRHALSSSSFSSKFNKDDVVALKLKSGCCSFSASQNRNLSPTIIDGGGLGRVGGHWSTPYPYDPLSKNPSDSSWLLACQVILLYPPMAWMVWRRYRPLWFNALLLIALALFLVWVAWASGKATVVKLQVGFSGKTGVGELGFHLNQIAESADTSTYKGLAYVLNETILALLRHLEYYESSSIYVVSVFGRQAANHYINSFSFEERVTNKETLINVNNVKLQSPTNQRRANDEYSDELKVTLFVGFRCDLKLQNVNNKYDLKNVLYKLRSVAASNFLTAVETLWTPQVSSWAASST